MIPTKKKQKYKQTNKQKCFIANKSSPIFMKLSEILMWVYKAKRQNTKNTKTISFVDQ